MFIVTKVVTLLAVDVVDMPILVKVRINLISVSSEYRLVDLRFKVTDAPSNQIVIVAPR